MAGASKRDHTNRLIEATSPYLLQHAHNPVDWYPWGEEALARAREEDKPILLSIGYSACHWCHVMAHESFEDEAVAALMNEHFVCVKVDREERPDLDDIYMAATVAMNQGQGGWPMTVFLTPEQEPFFAGTYFPPTDRWGRPGFRTLLGRIAELWRRERAKLREQGARIVEYLRENASSAPGLAVGENELRAAAAQLAQAFDSRWGGFGNAPKFPPSAALSLLLRVQRRLGDERALPMVRKTLDAMARGGMYDQVGGGFCRYSVDERWLVPHFEKMLYDNALLAKAYLEGHQATGEVFYARIAREILDYVLREMTSPEGGFYSATDADSEGEEGKFFVWTPEQIAEVLGDQDAGPFCAFYDISDGGNWEGKSIPNTPDSLESVAERLGLSSEALATSLEAARSRVYEARLKRVPPALDDKILTAWNGLMIGALAEGFRVLGDERYLAASRRAAGFLLATLRRPDGRLLRTYRAGKAHLDAYLEDYAYLAEALVDLYEAGGEERYLREAETLASQIGEGFSAPDGGYYSTAEGHERLVVRHREGHDGATPNANAVAACALARLSYHLGRDALREQAVAAIRAYGKAITRQPRGFAKTLLAVDLLLEGPVELALIGAPGSEGCVGLRAELAKQYLPNRIVAQHDPSQGPSSLPLLAGKDLVDGKPALYVCRDFSCRRPVTDPSEVAGALAEGGAPTDGIPHTLTASHLEGQATPAGTARYRERGSANGYAPLGETGLTCSRIGFGGYRVDDDTTEHREALSRALLGGCNLVDTSTNYTDGGSERLIGDVLSQLVSSGRLRRDEVIVVSKIGYVQGQNLKLAMDREQADRPFPGMVKHGEDLWHCIHPEYLADQLARSRDRLQLATLDVCLVHNPEYLLAAGNGDLEARRSELYARLREAFGFLEEQARAGRIACYGVSSNTCAAGPEDPEATSLTQMLEAARDAGGKQHRFRVLQLPMNLREHNAALRGTDGPNQMQTVLEQAAANGVGVLLNRPLNAIGDDGGLVRIADFPSTEARVELEAQLSKLSELEAEFNRRIAPHVRTGEGRLRADRLFRWGTDLRGLAQRLGGVPHWEHVEASLLMPRLVPILHTLDQTLTGSVAEDWRGWRARYLPELDAAMAELRRRAIERSREQVAPLAAALDAGLPPERRGESLSRKALWVLASMPGVSSVLVGTRKPSYVDDALGVLAWPALSQPLDLLARLPVPSPRSDG